jgi:hypothetical protein
LTTIILAWRQFIKTGLKVWLYFQKISLELLSRENNLSMCRLVNKIKKDKMIAESEKDIESGNIYAQDEVKKMIANWKE